METYLFVYGTLRQGFTNPLQHLLLQRGEFVGRARFQGRLFEVADYPAAVSSTTTDEWVVGEVYRLADSEQVLSQVDHYEECTPDFPEPREYRRQRVEVEFVDGRRLQAWTYLYNRPVAELDRIASGDYIRFRKGGSAPSTPGQ